YSVFSNPVLWFVQHGLGQRLARHRTREAIARAWERGYRPVNAAFADALGRELERSDGAPVVMLHDYHLYLVPAHLRARRPDILLQQFVHIPWPTPQHWLILPSTVRQELLSGILGNDLIGFQTHRDALNFLRTCDALMGETEVDYEQRTVSFRGRVTHVAAYPISIDVAEVRRLLAGPEVARWQRSLAAHLGERTIVRVDRLDPSKDVLGGFLAYERLLRERPAWRGGVRFLAFLVPSRDTIVEYRRYAQRVFRLVQRINTRFGTPTWQPVEVFYGQSYPRALAAMSLCDVMVVNSVADGMNLVAKEMPIANTRDGVLVLSTGAGAHEQLRLGALSVPRQDCAALAEALHRALTMSPAERRRRMELLRRAVEREDLPTWLSAQLADLCALRAARRGATARRGEIALPAPALIG
ncbi:MAG: trehalose-6-phosphate synthase, partial [Chloroflexi bacterium]|nr:trehalose-6-phosphate synthase [Chloroflexota bacterium]